ncbi:NUDIX domain-containing protein [Jannaschia aquimarina]|uniref:Adenosine nucleotide hydrolase NudE n=1 Tax=Jannaschia aquimarina TaxID=935700 RepID=A0A0D1D326_9RHOB|nr:NUDIX domain-containing protein [Jannaschia aquimarina]KIT14518.1 adenosine nucleotide hydrolase NudE [Jannaschia aquimarina]SNT35794.1 NUDIX domain-containing protein [Jannaschia aquimarina]
MTPRVCVVPRRGRAILAFRHPLAGAQLVKGRIEPGEGVAAAARRELREEAGLRARRIIRRGHIPDLGWHMVEACVGPVPECWSHFCEDDGGLLFDFFWHRPGADDTGFHPVFRRALREVRRWP